MFSDSLEYGKTGEQEVYDYLTSRGNYLDDVSMDKDYQGKDIDFIIIDKNGKQATLEVKSDKFSKTGNIYIEDEYVTASGNVKKGWLHYCQAELICYYDQRIKKGYIFHFDKLKSLLGKAKSIQHIDYQDGGIAQGLLLPIKETSPALVFEWSN